MFKRFIALFAFLSLLFGGISATANFAKADTNTDDKCLVSPEKTDYVKHKAEYVTESRWKIDIPEEAEVSHLEYRFFRDIPEEDAVYKLWHTFFRDIPAVDETFTTWYRWKLVEPTTVKEYRYKQVIPGTDGVKECQYKRWVKDYQTETRYVYQKKVSGDVYKEKPGQDPKVGTFDWEWFQGSLWNGGPLSHWGVWGNTAETEDSGPHSSISNTYTSGGNTLYKKSTSYKYFRTDQSETRQVENGGHWEYQWSTEDLGQDWIKTDTCRWKVEPIAETVLWYPSEDGWTTDVKDPPWIQDGERTVPGPNDISWFPSKKGWTKQVKVSPWVKVAEESRGNDDAIAGYREFKTRDGATLVESEASEFRKSEFPGWELLATRSEEVSPAVPGYREYLAKGKKATLDISEATWRKRDAIEGWTVLDSMKVVIEEFVPGYTEYYVSNDEDPTLVLGESNWTVDEPEGWIFVDSRERITKAAWTEKVVTAAKYEKCNASKLADTGADDDVTLTLFGLGSLFLMLGVAITAAARRNKA